MVPILTYTCMTVLSPVGSRISVGHVSIRAASVCACISVGACIPVRLSHRNPAGMIVVGLRTLRLTVLCRRDIVAVHVVRLCHAGWLAV